MRQVKWVVAIAAITTLWPAWAPAEDQDMAQQIADSLRTSGQLVDYSIGVKYENGSAWLIGRVANEQQRQQALALAQQMPSVWQVIDKLDVKPSQSSAVRSAPTVRFNMPSANEAAVEVVHPEQGADPNAGMVNLAQHQGQAVDSDPNAGATQSQAPQRRAVRGQKTVAARSYNNPGDPLAQSSSAQFVPSASRRFAGEPNYPMQGRPVASNRSAAARGPAANGDVTQVTQLEAAPGMQMQMQPMVGGPEAGNCPPSYRVAGGPPASPVGFHRGPRGVAPYGPGAMGGPAMGGCVGGACTGPAYEGPQMPNYAWPSYASSPNYAAVTYPRQYSPTAWPYIGPFYPYPQVPLGWRKVALEWDDGWWYLDFYDKHHHH